MNLVLRQSIKNSITTVFGFALGGINTLFLYTHFLQEDYYGLVIFLLSSGYLLMPMVTFGVHYAVLKFYSGYNTQKQRDAFFTFSLTLPLLIILPITAFFISFYEGLIDWISKDQLLIKNHGWLLVLMAIFAGYFEIFYSWAKVQLKSVFGNFVKELFARICVFVLLFAVYFELIDSHEFIYALMATYGLRSLIMLGYVLKIYKPRLTFKIPENIRDILLFSLFAIASGTSGSILFEIDKFMIPRYVELEKLAYYSVGIFIATVISIPGRAMQQITASLTAHNLNNNQWTDIAKLYKNSSISLTVAGGLLLLLINLNIHDLYQIIDKPTFNLGIPIVWMISIAKLSDLMLGTANDIIQNSKHYRFYFYFSVTMALILILLNYWLIPTLGINGAALSTLVVVVAFNLLKMLFVYQNFDLNLPGIKIIKVWLIILVIYAVFYQWSLDVNPYLNICIKSMLILVSYVFLIKKLKFINKFFNFRKQKK